MSTQPGTLTKMNQKQTVTYAQIEARLACLPLPDIDHVIGIANGGVVPARLVADKAQRTLSLIRVNYRNKDNAPKYDAPRVKSPIPTLPAGGRILLVDDVAVTGKTMGVVRALLADYAVTTLVFKGLGDIVLFPEMTTCVAWPWRQAAVSIHDCWIARSGISSGVDN